MLYRCTKRYLTEWWCLEKGSRIFVDAQVTEYMQHPRLPYYTSASLSMYSHLDGGFRNSFQVRVLAGTPVYQLAAQLTFAQHTWPTTCGSVVPYCQPCAAVPARQADC